MARYRDALSLLVIAAEILKGVIAFSLPRKSTKSTMASAALSDISFPTKTPLVFRPPPPQVSTPLLSGDLMPACGLGTWKLGSNTESIVYEAIKEGYRHVDCAADYGNEVEVGKGIRRAIQEGIVTREELFVTGKLWSTHHRKEHVGEALAKSLSDLNLEYLDLYLIHFPIAITHVPIDERYPPGWYDPLTSTIEFDHVPLRETWEALELLHFEGRVRNLGLCNTNTALLWDLLSYARIKPSVLQIERHVYNQHRNLLLFCGLNYISVVAYSPIGASGYVSIGLAKESQSALDEPLIKEIAASHGKTAAQILLRWNFQTGCSIIPKSSTVGRLEENISIFDFLLSSSELEQISALDKGLSFNDPAVFMGGMGAFLPIFD